MNNFEFDDLSMNFFHLNCNQIKNREAFQFPYCEV